MRLSCLIVPLLLPACMLIQSKDPKSTQNIDLSAVVWTYQKDDITQLCQIAHDELDEKIEHIKASETIDFDNTARALDQVLTVFKSRTQSLAFYSYVHENPDIRDAAKNCEDKAQKRFLEVFTDLDLYKRLTAVMEKTPTLGGDSQRLLEFYFLQFKENGLSLPVDKRKKLLALRDKINDIESAFTKNLTNWDEKLQFSKVQLKGLPVAVMDELEPGSQPDTVLLTLKYPHAIPALEYVENADVRKEISQRFLSVGGPQNVELLEKALILRAQMAGILGYKSFAELRLTKTMAKNPKTVNAFLTKIESRIKAGKDNDLARLLASKKKDFPKQRHVKLNSWDIPYYSRKIQEEFYKIDEEEIRKYFPLDKVLKGMFAAYENLLSVDFQEIKSNTWHESVKFFTIKDRNNGELIGGFYMDLFPRSGKYGHAAAFDLKKPYLLGETYQKPISAIVCNFRAPTKDSPSLLNHDEVETLFHEFGHIMHQSLTKAQFGSLAGFDVLRDFVEAPSQMLENWVWEDTILKMMSGHYKTGDSLPLDLQTKLIASRKFNQSLLTMNQVFYAKVDMAYHSLSPSSQSVDSTAIWLTTFRKTLGYEQVQALRQAGFGHLMGGYEAGYYGYLWSKVYAQDMFTRFKASGILNKELGLLYRKEILEQGNSENPLVLIEKFLGRKASEDAFIKELEEEKLSPTKKRK